MLKFLFSFLSFGLIIIFLVVIYFVWMFWKMRKKMNELSERAAQQRQRERAARGDNVSMADENQSQKEKIFAEDEGEYVDFEEEP